MSYALYFISLSVMHSNLEASTSTGFYERVGAGWAGKRGHGV